MQTLYENPSYTVYNVDSPVFYIQLIKAALLKIKNYVPFIHWCKTASFFSDAHENL